MTKTVENENKIDRRRFFKLAGAAGAAASTGQLTQSAAAATTHTMTGGDHAGEAGYQFFNTDESAFIESAIDTLIPSDSTGPGAMELGVAIYIDRQMAGGYGKGDRLYLEGPSCRPMAAIILPKSSNCRPRTMWRGTNLDRDDTAYVRHRRRHGGRAGPAVHGEVLMIAGRCARLSARTPISKVNILDGLWKY